MRSVSSYSVPEPIRVETVASGQLVELELEGSFEPSTDVEALLARDLEAAGLIRPTEPKRGKATKVEPETTEES
jgi:hypothetical protein